MLFEFKEQIDRLAVPFYRLRGRRPWSPGYYTEKKRTICSAIDTGLISGTEALPPGYGSHLDERVVEYPWLFAQLPKSPGRILDAGSALNHRFLIDRPPLRDASLTIMTLAPEKRCYWRHSISYVFADLRHTQFADASFDVIVSVSTIEHIGLDNTMLYTSDTTKKEANLLGFVPAVAEFKRLLRPDGLCLITVPFGRAGGHGWYQVFDSNMVEKVMDVFQPSEHQVDYFGYSETGWRRTTPDEISDAEFFDVHEGRPFSSDFAAGARGIACMRLRA